MSDETFPEGTFLEVPLKMAGMTIGTAVIDSTGMVDAFVDNGNIVRGILDAGSPTHLSVDPQAVPSANRTLSDADIEHRFGFHKATVEGANATLPVHKELRLTFRALAEKLDALLPPGRAKSVCLTELETVSMWAHKANAELSPLVEE